MERRRLFEVIREILRHEYIGAITIGFLLAQSAIHLITAIVQPLSFYLEPGRSSILTGDRSFPWERLVLPNVVSAVLLFIVAFALIRWLYLGRFGMVAAENPPEMPDQSA
jgi:hypothetical protein